MDGGLGSAYNPSGPIDRSRILDVKPLRTLSPIFPSQTGPPSFSSPLSAPFTCVPPTGPFPSGVAPFYPFAFGNESQGAAGFDNTIPSPVPLNSFRTPQSQYSNGDAGPSKRGRGRPRKGTPAHENDYSNSQSMSDNVEDFSTERTQKGKSKKRTGGPISLSSIEVNVDDLVAQLLRAFGLVGLDPVQQSDGNKELVGRILLTYNLLRRRFFQISEAQEAFKRTDGKAAGILTGKGIRTNTKKRIGTVPGVEVGDIFFTRMEMCMVGMHAPTMAGIDYLNVKTSADEEPAAVSVVSSGGYEDDTEEGDGSVLIYTGHGGVQRKDGQIFDQKLVRGNLALEKSLHRSNVVRVIRGVKDVFNPLGKIYVYDGLYKIHESWVEKGKSGFNVFKYKFVREPGQPEAFTLWKSIEQWKNGTKPRNGVILPDLTSGLETLPVCLVNDVDNEKGPAYFTYIPSLKYDKPFELSNPSASCTCRGGCQPGDSSCPCVQRNRGFLPYNSLGVILGYKSLIHECGPSCVCPPNCRNRLSQAGLKVRLEVFRTKDRGWGLRSWDPIRSGMFICEYAGDVVDTSNSIDLGNENEDHMFDATRVYPQLDSNSDESAEVPFPLVISAKNSGNVGRFMNHSCSPNVFWQPILRDMGNRSYLHIGFFAIGHIPPMQELTFDYGIPKSDNTEQRRKSCLCASWNCKGYFY